MGLLSFFSKQTRTPAPLPSGSFTVDARGEIVSSTVPSSFPKEHLKHLGGVVLEGFAQARRADQPVTELHVQFSALNLKAKELRGGALIFLSPRGGRVR